MERSVLMLDVDGVLVGGRPQDGLGQFTDLEADLGLSPDKLRKRFFDTYWADVVTGKRPLLETLAPVLADIAPDLPAQTLVDYWLANDSRIDGTLLADLPAVRQGGMRIYLATNQEHVRAKYLMETMGLGDYVDGIVYSAALGCRKPEPEFYWRAATQVGAKPRDIVFIDDNAYNVTAARKAGWAAMQWTAGMTLAAALSTAR